MELNFLIFLLLFLEVVESKALYEWRKGLLLQVNKVYTKRLPPKDSLKFDISLFQSCPQFTMILTTETFDSTRVLFAYSADAATRLQVSVDSTQILPTTGPPPATKDHVECTEKLRKSILMKVERAQFNYRITIDDRTFLRQRQPFDNDLKVFIPQQTTNCCLIRAILYEPEISTDSVLQRRTKFTAGNQGDRFGTGGKVEVIQREETTIPYAHPTLSTFVSDDSEESSYSLYSWTRRINERWITTFFVFGTVFFVFLVVFSVFGVTMFVCLQKTPDDTIDQSVVAASTINTFRSVLSKQSTAKTTNPPPPDETI
ncbi:unnamed protein product, partial [Mesorhabditis belari]|uniref:Uncharacterized protein n=1 Tax=Mesorhabditis belari TaxID=2138241 RepID=A0AAF3FGK2_9BILA